MARLTEEEKDEIIKLYNLGVSSREIARRVLGRKSRKTTVNDFLATLRKDKNMNYIQKLGSNAPKVLFFDIETAPMLGYVWSLWNNNVPLNMLHSDWYILSFAVSWADSEEVHYYDNRHANDLEDDRTLMEILWDYLEEADIVVGHNIRKFDVRRIKARMIQHGIKPFSHVKIYDTMEMSKRNFDFPSHKLEYIASILCPENEQKSKHSKYAGFDLWKGVMNGDQEAWDEMAEYCPQDVVTNKAIFWKMYCWDNKAPNFEVYTGEEVDMTQWEDIGFYYTTHGKYKKYRHKDTGMQRRGKINLLDKDVRISQLVNMI